MINYTVDRTEIDLPSTVTLLSSHFENIQALFFGDPEYRDPAFFPKNPEYQNTLDFFTPISRTSP
jgi:hypothetical protein